MSTLKRSKLLMQKDLEKRARKKISSDLRSPRKRVGGTPGVNPKFIPIEKQEKELNKGYKGGGAVLKGKKVGCQIK